MAVEKVTYVLTLNDLFTPKIQDAEKATGGLDNAVKKVALTVGAAFAADKILSFGGHVIDTLAEFQKYDAVLTNTLGSSSESKKVLADITDFAAKTPFQVNELTGSFVKLANMGFKPTTDEMRSLGDLASSTGKGFDQLSEAIIDAQTGEFERLKEFGIRAKKQGDDVQFSFKGVKTTVDNSEESIQKYLLSLGDLNGVSGSMAAISATTGGQLSNLEDNMTSLYLTIGEKLEPYITKAISAASGFIDTMKEAVTWLSKNKEMIGLVASAVAGGALALGGYVIALKAVAFWTATASARTVALMLINGVLAGEITVVTAAQWLFNAALTANPIGIVVVAIGALIAGVIYAYNTFGKFRAIVWASWAVIKEFASIVGNVFMGLAKTMYGVMSFSPSMITEGVTQTIDAVRNSATKIGNAAKEGYEAGLGDFNKGVVVAGDKKKDKVKDKTVTNAVTPTPNISPKGATGTKAVTINITIGKLIEQFKITTTNIHESTGKVQEMVANALLQAVNDSSIQAGI